MKDQIIAFSALCQIAQMVQTLARKGTIDDNSLTVMLNSIINTAPDNTLTVYGGKLSHLDAGLRLLVGQLSDDSTGKDPELTRYIVSLIALAGKLIKRPAAMNELGNRIDDIGRQLDHFSVTSESITANLAGIYSDLISPLGNKIQVSGDSTILSQTVNQHKIRALLLAGVRAVVLWRQLGGKRRHILFKRKQILQAAQQLLNQI